MKRTDCYASHCIIKVLFHLIIALCMQIVAPLPISTDSKVPDNEEPAIVEYARRKHFAIDRFLESEVYPNRRNQRQIDQLLGTLATGDRLVVGELFCLGSSSSQVIRIIGELVKRKVRFIATKEAIRVEGTQDSQTMAMVALFWVVCRGRELSHGKTDQ